MRFILNKYENSGQNGASRKAIFKWPPPNPNVVPLKDVSARQEPHISFMELVRNLLGNKHWRM